MARAARRRSALPPASNRQAPREVERRQQRRRGARVIVEAAAHAPCRQALGRVRHRDDSCRRRCARADRSSPARVHRHRQSRPRESTLRPTPTLRQSATGRACRARCGDQLHRRRQIRSSSATAVASTSRVSHPDRPRTVVSAAAASRLCERQSSVSRVPTVRAEIAAQEKAGTAASTNSSRATTSAARAAITSSSAARVLQDLNYNDEMIVVEICDAGGAGDLAGGDGRRTLR